MSNKNRKKLTLNEFIDRSNELHEFKYTYDNSEITNSNSDVIVTCLEHGDFTVNARRHYTKSIKQGCPKCINYERIDLQEFIRRSVQVHGEKYHYGKVEYLGSGKQVILTCPEHGDFSVTPSLHYGPRKVGCTKCSNKAQLGTKEFIERAKGIHGEKYDYTETVYTSTQGKVKITCPKHGVFLVRASEHIGKSATGCKWCSRESIKPLKMDTESFKIESANKHGNKYDYSKSIYISAREKITVTCREHGDFHIRASAHYGKQKQGCPSCAGRPSINKDEFIERSKQIHLDRFEYDQTCYLNAKTKVIIKCIEHGYFEVLPGNHLNGNGGCKKCSGRPDITNDDFKERLFDLFGTTLDYDKVNYQGQGNLVTLTCKIHGDFNGYPTNILRLKGCPECEKFDLKDFIEKSNIIHNGKYDYRNSNYINTLTPVIIICPKHGEFLQKPITHLANRGCQTCGIERNLLSNREPNEKCFLYFLKLSYKSHLFWKIGITTKSIETRFASIAKDNVIISVKSFIETTIQNAIFAESLILSDYEDYSVYKGHILKHSKGGTECFKIDVFALSGKTLLHYVEMAEEILIKKML